MFRLQLNFIVRYDFITSDYYISCIVKIVHIFTRYNFVDIVIPQLKVG